ncbi:mechanosensitive ion channel family protein, partial [Bacillus licheniformis]
MNSLRSVFKNVFEPFFQQERWAHIGEGFIKILLILLISMFLIRIGKQALNKFVEVRTNSPLRISERREATMVRLLQNVFSYVIYFVAGVMILETLSVDVRGLLAGAGIVGLGVGFGAQNLMKD